MADIDAIYDANKVLYAKVEDTFKMLDGVQQLVSDEFEKYYCNKSISLCPKLKCEYRKDPMEKEIRP